MKIKETEAAIEAILFAMGGSVELPRIARAIGVDEKTTGRIIRNMMDRYQEENRGIQIIELENSFQMCTKKEYYQYLINIALHPQKPALSDVMLETLSIIAYKQPGYKGRDSRSCTPKQRRNSSVVPSRIGRRGHPDAQVP